MSKGNTLETGILNLILNNINLADIGDATGLRGSTTAGSLYISLHTADPGEGGSQTTSETAYTGYARVAIARSGAQWTVVSGAASNAALVTFGACTAAPGGNITNFGVGTASSGAGVLLYKGALAAALVMSSAPSTIPEFAIGDLDITED
jgi:hypothetical protein